MKYAFIPLFLAMLCMACDPFANPRYSGITFSSDTVFFDTVFTTLGSATKEVRAKNLSDKPLLIDKIWLAGGETSPFRINVNGISSPEVNNITVPAGDSIFIFVDVTVNPENSDNPVLETDSVMAVSGNYLSRIILEAWGQDIKILRSDTIRNETWSPGKPYVVYGSVLVDTATILNVEAGTKIFFHNKASMKVAGSLLVSGSGTLPVTISSDRISKDFEDIPGQWEGIRFLSCSKSNKIKDAVIRNADVAVEITGAHLKGEKPDIVIENTSVLHNSVNSISASYAVIKSYNSLFAHTGFNTVSLTDGTEADFVHCTIANQWEYNIRNNTTLFLGRGKDGDGELPSAMFYNSVIAGDNRNEVTIDATPLETEGKVFFDSCFIVIDSFNCKWWNRKCLKGTIIDKQPGFIDWHNYDFRPDTLSKLVDAAGKVESMLLPEDIRHKPRPVFNAPDIGAFERQPGEKKKKP